MVAIANGLRPCQCTGRIFIEFSIFINTFAIDNPLYPWFNIPGQKV